MKTALWIAAVVAGLAIVGTARYSAHQPDLGEVERILQSIRERGIPASIVQFPRTNSVLLQAGIQYSEQPTEWQTETLEQLRLACGADCVWHTSVVPD